MSVIFLESNTSVEIVLMLWHSSFFSIMRRAWYDKLAILVHRFEFGNRSWRGNFLVPSFRTVQFYFWVFLSQNGIKIFRSLHFKLNFFWISEIYSISKYVFGLLLFEFFVTTRERVTRSLVPTHHSTPVLLMIRFYSNSSIFLFLQVSCCLEDGYTLITVPVSCGFLISNPVLIISVRLRPRICFVYKPLFVQGNHLFLKHE